MEDKAWCYIGMCYGELGVKTDEYLVVQEWQRQAFCSMLRSTCLTRALHMKGTLAVLIDKFFGGLASIMEHAGHVRILYI